MENTQTPEVGTDVVRSTRLQDSYKRWQPVFAAIPKDKLDVSMNVDIPGVVTMVCGSIKQILPLKAQAAEELPKADLSVFENVEGQALALGYSHGRHQAASAPTLSLQELSAKVVHYCEIFLGEAQLAAKRGLISSSRFKDLKGLVGYKNQATDQVTLVATMRDNWTALQGRTGLTLADIDEAEMYADQLFTAIGEREQLPMTTAATFEARQRAFVLFMETYDDVRRIVHYLRWKEGDANEIAPSVYAGRKREKGEKPVEEVTEAVASDAVQAAAKPANEIAVGMPGASPFS